MNSSGSPFPVQKPNQSRFPSQAGLPFTPGMPDGLQMQSGMMQFHANPSKLDFYFSNNCEVRIYNEEFPVLAIRF